MQPDSLPKEHLLIVYHINIYFKKSPANELSSQSGPVAPMTHTLSLTSLQPCQWQSWESCRNSLQHTEQTLLCNAACKTSVRSQLQTCCVLPWFSTSSYFPGIWGPCLELAQHGCKQPDEQPRRETAIFGNAPFLEATDISKKIQRQSLFLEATLSYRSAFLKTKCSSLSHNITSGSAYWVSVAVQPPAEAHCLGINRVHIVDCKAQM